MCTVWVRTAATQEGSSWAQIQSGQQKCEGLHRCRNQCRALADSAASSSPHGSNPRRIFWQPCWAALFPTAHDLSFVPSLHMPETAIPTHLEDVWVPSTDWQDMHQNEASQVKPALDTPLKLLLKMLLATKSWYDSLLSCQLMRLSSEKNCANHGIGQHHLGVLALSQIENLLFYILFAATCIPLGPWFPMVCCSLLGWRHSSSRCWNRVSHLTVTVRIWLEEAHVRKKLDPFWNSGEANSASKKDPCHPVASSSANRPNFTHQCQTTSKQSNVTWSCHLGQVGGGGAGLVQHHLLQQITRQTAARGCAGARFRRRPFAPARPPVQKKRRSQKTHKKKERTTRTRRWRLETAFRKAGEAKKNAMNTRTYVFESQCWVAKLLAAGPNMCFDSVPEGLGCNKCFEICRLGLKHMFGKSLEIQ